MKLAVRPEAWLIESEGRSDALAAKLSKCAYLGSSLELSFDTELGAIFVVSPDVKRRYAVGDCCSLRLGERGLSVVGA